MTYKLFLKELHLGDLDRLVASGTTRRLLDLHTTVALRGAALMAHRPKYQRFAQHLPKVSRGIRLVYNSATHAMQEALGTALAHATQAKLVSLDYRRLEAVKDLGVAEGVPRRLLTTRQLVATLMDMIHSENEPYVVFLPDKGDAVLRSRGACLRLMQELKDNTSRVFFLLSSASDPSYHPTRAGEDGMPTPSGSSPRMSVTVRPGQPGSPTGLPPNFTPSPGGMPPFSSQGRPGFPPPDQVQKALEQALEKIQEYEQENEMTSDSEDSENEDSSKPPVPRQLPPELKGFLQETLQDPALVQQITDQLQKLPPLGKGNRGPDGRPNPSHQVHISVFHNHPPPGTPGAPAGEGATRPPMGGNPMGLPPIGGRVAPSPAGAPGVPGGGWLWNTEMCTWWEGFGRPSGPRLPLPRGGSFWSWSVICCTRAGSWSVSCKNPFSSGGSWRGTGGLEESSFSLSSESEVISFSCSYSWIFSRACSSAFCT
mmetsp:Transcript_15271/g.19553  ORF Transcript_15271/g.19553 Transcript_15271/m.19553 type:complete len:484 (+) Transcript_15271:1-1452(+)